MLEVYQKKKKKKANYMRYVVGQLLLKFLARGNIEKTQAFFKPFVSYLLLAQFLGLW